MVKKRDFKVFYRGKTYTRIADFAKDVGLSTRVVLERVRRGWTDPSRLAQPLIKHGQWHAPYKVEYKGIVYNSLAEFARSFGLSYTKAKKYWIVEGKGPEYIIEHAKPTSQQESTADMLEMKKIDEKAKHRHLKKNELLSIGEVVEATGVQENALRRAISNMIRTDEKRAKSDMSNIGIWRSDIVPLTDDEETKKSISNKAVVPNYGLSRYAVEHIKGRQDFIKSLNLAQVPHFQNYFYSFKTQRLFSLSSGVYREIEPKKQKHSMVFPIKKDKKRYHFSSATIEDYISHPEIRYEDLVSYADLEKITGHNQNWWKNNGISQTFPQVHRRYSFDGEKKRKQGFVRSELKEALKKHSKSKKFASLL